MCSAGNNAWNTKSFVLHLAVILLVTRSFFTNVVFHRKQGSRVIENIEKMNSRHAAPLIFISFLYMSHRLWKP